MTKYLILLIFLFPALQCVDTNIWDIVFNGFEAVAVSNITTWGLIPNSNNPYGGGTVNFNNAAQLWTAPDGLCITLSMQGKYLICRNGANRLYKRTLSPPGSWLDLSTDGIDFKSSKDGQAWMLSTSTTGSNINTFNCDTNTPSNVPGPNGAKIGPGPNGTAWLVTSGNIIYSYNGTSWTQIPGLATDIFVDAYGIPYIFTSTISTQYDGYIIQWWNASSYSWINVDGIAGISMNFDDLNTLYVTTSTGDVYRRRGTITTLCPTCNINCNSVSLTAAQVQSCQSTLCISTTLCIPCLYGVHPDTSTNTCGGCSTTNCNLCPNQSICEVCRFGYMLANNQCTQCPNGTYPIYNNCSVCSDHCAVCANTSACQTCNPGYGLIGGQCVVCPGTTFPTPTSCSACSNNCAVCTNTSICLSCSSGYGLVNSQCVTCPNTTYPTPTSCSACPNQCAVCTNSATCQTCNPGYNLVNNLCMLCSSGSYVTSTGCVNCPSTCMTCSNSSACLTCKSGYGLYKHQCVSCPDSTYLSNGTCLNCPPSCASCIDYDTCKLTTQELKTAQTLASATTQAAAITKNVLSASTAISASNPALITSAGLVQLLLYIRYINITHSERLEIMFESGALALIVINIDYFQMSDEMQNAFSNTSAPYMFDKYNVTRSFLVNFWDTLVSLLLLLGATIILWSLQRGLKWLRGLSNTKAIVKWAKGTVQNLLIAQFYGSYGDFMTFAILELQDPSIDETYDVLSFMAAISFIVIGCILLIVLILVVRRIRRLKRTALASHMNHEMKLLHEHYNYMKVLFADFRSDSYLQQGFLVLLTVRDICYSFILTLLYDYPLAQVCIFTLLSSVMVLFILIKPPFHSKLDLVQQVVFELLVLCGNSSLLGLAILDRVGGVTYTGYLKDRLSNAIVMLNLVASLLPWAFFLPRVVVSIYLLVKAVKKIQKDTRVQRHAAQTPSVVSVSSLRPDRGLLEMQQRQLNESFSSCIQLAKDKSIIGDDSSVSIIPENVLDVEQKKKKKDRSPINEKSPQEGKIKRLKLKTRKKQAEDYEIQGMNVVVADQDSTYVDDRNTGRINKIRKTPR